MGVEQLVELPRHSVDDEHVPIARARRTALDRRAVGMGYGPGSLSSS
jgi:hypothetical protein